MSEKVNDVNKKGGWARFMEWYGSYQGKRVVGMVYSIGAAVVIVGSKRCSELLGVKGM